MRHFAYVMAAVLAAVSLSCTKHGSGTGQNGGGGNPDDTRIPEPPETVVEGNVFLVDFFSALDGACFWEMRDFNVSVSHIKGQSGKKPLVYMFDRSDFEVGKDNNIIRIATASGMSPLFAQNTESGDYIEGTGMVTLYSVADYDGVHPGEGVFMSGCRFSAPLNEPVPLCIYTARVGSVKAMQQLFESRAESLRTDAVLIGTVKNSVSDEVEKYISANAGPVRFMLQGMEDKDYDLFVMVPASFACRSVEENVTVNHPYFRISIEKIM